jgi:catechol 2,3-dioxygenase-like lactoylglutathione lyase family enzyme
MAIREIHHVALTVSDLEKSTAFYKSDRGVRGSGRRDDRVDAVTLRRRDSPHA